MKKYLLPIIVLIAMLLPISSFATHIVGGSLTYVYNGGNVYTVTYKFYRDCGPNTAGLPGSVTIQVYGNNGVAFTPSKNLTINLTSQQTLNSTLDPCAVQPNPSPCVQEAIYTTTVSLPPNIGGYHLYYQDGNRNFSISNLVGPGATGEGIYAYIPGLNNAGNNFIANSNPTFNLFPPLFLCVNQPFTFNHAATDVDGDVLVYSLYHPYDNNGIAFTGNTATFIPVTFAAGYSANNPLGGAPIIINPTTGMLSGTPPTIGQFVVGIMVQEYRNGVLIGSTIRDFQFNILNCPIPPPAITVANVSVNNGCNKPVIASGIIASSATWTSIFPGALGTYNSFLSCTSGCLTPTITPTGVPPAFVDYKVCGTSVSCAGNNVCDTVRVTFNAPLVVNIQPSNPIICFGQTSTTITAIPSGGVAPYTYLWNNVNPAQTINVGVGTFNIKLTDATGCPPAFNSVIVTTYTAPITANAGADKLICKQSPATIINASVLGASGGIWSGGAGTFSPNNTTLSNVTYSPSAGELTAGAATLFLTSTGNLSCPADRDTVVIRYSNFTAALSASNTNVSCFGFTNGSSTINPTGGVGPFTYTWTTTPIQNSQTATGLIPGTYSVTIKDGIGCKTQTVVSISQPTSALAVNGTFTNVLCNGAANGSITALANGGTPGYTYLWAPGSQTTASVTALNAGTYTVTAKDTKSCTATNTFVITEPTALSVVVTKTNVTCFSGTDGLLSALVTGGTSPYTYSWTATAANTPSVSNLIAGTYTLIVKDFKGCIVTTTVTIIQPALLVPSVTFINETCAELNNGSANATTSGGNGTYTYTWMPINLNTNNIASLSSGNYTLFVEDVKACKASTVITITQPLPLVANITSSVNVSCFGGNNASITAAGSGGTPNYTYSWSPGGATTSTISNIAAGTYTLLVKDTKLCATQTIVTISQPTAALAVVATVTNVFCFNGNNGAINLTTTGGTSPYGYTWLNAGQITQNLNTLVAANYSVTILDAKNCSTTASYSVTQPNALAIAFSTTNTTCSNLNNGLITTTVTGGTTAYSYSWTPTLPNSPNVINLSANTYTLKVTDSKLCTLTQTVTIIKPLPLTITTSITPESCNYLNNGSATVTATGGTAGYTYSWSPSAITTTTIDNLASGTYTVRAFDANGCGVVKTNVIVTQPTQLNALITSQTNEKCFGDSNGKAFGGATGSNGTYTYSWSPTGTTASLLNNIPAGTYSLMVTDVKGCQDSITVTITEPAILQAILTTTNALCNAGTTGVISVANLGGTANYTNTIAPGNSVGNTFSNLVAGTYTINTKDAKGCVNKEVISITEPAKVASVLTVTNSNCGQPNGEITIAVTSGGTPAFTYSWLPAGGTNSLAIGLLAGNYQCQITDANGCKSFTNTNILDLGAPVVSILSTTNVACFGDLTGAASATFTGVGSVFTQTWSPSGGNNLVTSGVPTGIYTIRVEDQFGCIGVASTTLISQPTPLSSQLTATTVSCFNGANGKATVITTGGSPGYTYSWSPSGVTTTTIANLIAGIYTVNVTDTHSCVSTSTVLVTQPTASLTAALSSVSVSCFGGFNGAVLANATGGTPAYSYTWMPGNFSGASLTNVIAGTYSVTIDDENDCVFTETVTVIEPADITLSIATVNSNCSIANGQATVNAVGGTNSFLYQWQPTGGITFFNTTLLANTYTVKVFDSNGCNKTTTLTVGDNPAPLVSISSVTNVSCYGANNALATASVTGGTGVFTYTWLPVGGNALTGLGLGTGTSTVEVTSGNGCLVTATTTMITEPLPLLTTIIKTDVTCNGTATGAATVTPTGGTGAYLYNWLIVGGSTPIRPGLTVGTYSVRVTDALNCSLITTVQINQPQLLVINSVSATNVDCNGNSTGSATLAISGGNLPYSYNWQLAGSNSPIANGLPIGTYTVNVTDAKGCTTNTFVTITQPPLALSATASGTGVTCFGGSNGTASVTVNGGTLAYTYTWQPSGGNNAIATNLPNGNYYVTVKDARGCTVIEPITIAQTTPITGSIIVDNAECNLPNGNLTAQIQGGIFPYTYTWISGGTNSPNLNNIVAGNYTLNIVDANNCPQTFSTTVLNLPAQTVAITSSSNVACFGLNTGSATINITQGTAPYVINWMPNGGNGLAATALVAATYTAVVTDDKGCVVTKTVVVNEPLAPLSIASSTIVDVLCNGGNNGSVIINATGGTSGYTYSWIPNTSSTNVASLLTMGLYTVFVTDANNCKTSLVSQIDEPTALTTAITSFSNPPCFNADGSATIFASGGTIPYTYNWNSTPVQSGLTLQGVKAGSYNVTTTDANGCVKTNSIVLVQPAQIITSASIGDVICSGQQGSVSALATGGLGSNYSYAWYWVANNEVNTGTLNISPTTSTNYTVVAFDLNGCAGLEDTVSIVVYNLTQAQIATFANSPICPGGTSVVYTELTGNTGPVTFAWTPNIGNTKGPFILTPPGTYGNAITYSVTVTNTACAVSITDTVTINFNPKPKALPSVVTNTTCAPGKVQFLQASTTGNVNDPIAVWTWDFGDGSTSNQQQPIHAYLNNGTYTVTLSVVTDGGCKDNSSATPIVVNAYATPIANFTVNNTFLQLPYDKVLCTNTSSLASQYVWNFGDGIGTSTAFNAQYLYNTVGFYTISLVAINNFGCRDTAYVKIETDASVVFPNVFTPNPDAENAGEYDVASLDNNVFFPYTAGVVEYSLEIFNRWGELIFVSDDVKKGWNGYYRGKLCQLGAYVWKAKVKLNDGKTFNKTGDVTLLR